MGVARPLFLRPSWRDLQKFHVVAHFLRFKHLVKECEAANYSTNGGVGGDKGDTHMGYACGVKPQVIVVFRHDHPAFGRGKGELFGVGMPPPVYVAGHDDVDAAASQAIDDGTGDMLVYVEADAAHRA